MTPEIFRLIAASLVVVLSINIYAQNGKIKGSVYDKHTGEPMVGANVYLEGTTTGSSTDLNGNFFIQGIPQGQYVLVVSFIGYQTKKIPGIEIRNDTVIEIKVLLEEMESETVEEVVVSASAIRNSENAVLAIQKAAVSLQDGISAQEIDKIGASNAAESAKQITGTSVVDGRFVLVRGLGDRYTTAQLNGATLVSTDPYVNSVPLDLIPSSFLANIMTSKSASPDLPGNFSGGVIQLNTRDIPEERIFEVEAGIDYNPRASFNRNFLTHKGGKFDWLGYDDGYRALPDILKEEENLTLLSSPAFYIQARNNPAYASLLDRASKSLNPQMSPANRQSFTGYKAALTFGNRYRLFGNPLGVLFNLTHRKNYTFYNDGINKAWDITGSSADQLFLYYDLQDKKGVENPVVSGMAGITYQIGKHTQLGVLNIYNHDTEKISRYQRGIIPGVVSGSDKIFETRTLQFTERGLNTLQLHGNHQFPSLNHAELQWVGSYTQSYQNEPDLRFFANETIGDSLYFISVSEYDLPYHYFRYLTDHAYEWRADFRLPLSGEKELTRYLKTGFGKNVKTRDFDEYRFYYKNKDGEPYRGDQYAFFGQANTGIIGYDSLYNKWIAGNYLVNNSKVANNYQGKEDITAGYVMLVYALKKNLTIAGGLRVEHTHLLVESADTNQKKGNINQFDFFPSLNLKYALTRDMNLRVSYSRTIARPTIRELAPFVTFDFIGCFLYLGNPDLEPTRIHNYDLRWEYFFNRGEVFAISGYYKKFRNPIVKAFNTDALNPEVVFQNTNDANVYGFEVDFRKNFGFIGQGWHKLKLNANFSYIISKVALDSAEYKILAEINPEIDAYRPFQGQSPYLFNAVLSYDEEKAGLEVNLSFNIFGKRLAAIGLNGLPDVYEKPMGLMNLSVMKTLGDELKLKFEAENLLDAEFQTTQTFNGTTYLNESHRIGRTYSLTLTYLLN